MPFCGRHVPVSTIISSLIAGLRKSHAASGGFWLLFWWERSS